MKKHPSSQFGVTSMGEKGQVVIPADIREQLKLTKGEKLIVICTQGKITLVPSAAFEHMAQRLSAIQDVFTNAKKK